MVEKSTERAMRRHQDFEPRVIRRKKKAKKKKAAKKKPRG